MGASLVMRRAASPSASTNRWSGGQSVSAPVSGSVSGPELVVGVGAAALSVGFGEHAASATTASSAAPGRV